MSLSSVSPAALVTVSFQALYTELMVHPETAYHNALELARVGYQIKDSKLANIATRVARLLLTQGYGPFGITPADPEPKQ